jgi:hypothetical protein
MTIPHGTPAAGAGIPAYGASMTTPNGAPAPGSPSASQALPTTDDLRLLVREVLREILPTIVPAPPQAADSFDVTWKGTGALPCHIERMPDVGSAARGGARGVRLADDADLAAFVAEIVRLAGDPRQRQDLLAGRLRFTLTTSPTGSVTHTSPTRPGQPFTSITTTSPTAPGQPSTSAVVRRVEKGAVTERAVVAAAKAGERLVLGPKAVLTPLGRDKARALGVTVEKER